MTPLVSIVMPCLNEKAHVRRVVENVLSLDIPSGGAELLVIDGMSDDGTREELGALSRENTRLRVLDNEARVTPAALNIGILAAAGEIIIRLDMHTQYQQDYLVRCVEELRSTGAENVGGSWHAVGHTFIQSAIALAFNSPFSAGGARSHDSSYEGPVDSVYLGCWRRSTLLEIVLFDPTLVRNKDDELNLRIVRNGGRVWQARSIRSYYSPRSTIRELWRQYFQYGYWKVKVVSKHGSPASWRHFVPAGLVVCIGTGILLSPVWPVLGTVLVAPYALSVASASLLLGLRSKATAKYLPVLPVVLATFHLSYGVGFLLGLTDRVLARRRESAFRVTRGLGS